MTYAQGSHAALWLVRSARLTYIAVQQTAGLFPAWAFLRNLCCKETTMTDITVGTMPASVSGAAHNPDAAKAGFFKRMFDALVEARMRQAQAIVKQYHETGTTMW